VKLYKRHSESYIVSLYRKAAAWLADHGEIGEALDYLLTIADYGPAADLLESQRLMLLNDRRYQDLADALALLPPQLLNQRPLLLLSQAWIYNFYFERAPCIAVARRVEQMLQTSAERPQEPLRQVIQLELLALLCMDERGQEAEQIVARILASWQKAQPYLAYTHAEIVMTLAGCCQALGNVKAGLYIVDTALARRQEWPVLGYCSILSVRAIMHYWDLNLHQSEHDLQTNLHQARQYDLSSIAGLCQLLLATIAIARFQLDLAEAYLTKVLSDLYVENGRYAILGLIKLIDIYTFQGRPINIQPYVEKVRAYVLMVNLGYVNAHVAALEAYLAMAQGDVTHALGWALGGLQEALDTSMYGVSDRTLLIRGRILLREGSPASLEQASQILGALAQHHEKQHIWTFAVEALIAQALALAKLGQMTPALVALGKAVRRAVPSGAVGLFIMEGPYMYTLLQALREQEEYRMLVDLLLATFPPEYAIPVKAVSEAMNGLLAEPLTERETAVLRLLADGLSNKDIAQRLVISVNTVRNHIVNIFGKLQATNRFQAVARARALGLLLQAEQLSMPESSRQE
jgi:LuxR family maltose regulon positive regulatory protein